MQMSMQNHPIKQESRRWPNQEPNTLRVYYIKINLACIHKQMSFFKVYNVKEYLDTQEALVGVHYDVTVW